MSDLRSTRSTCVFVDWCPARPANPLKRASLLAHFPPKSTPPKHPIDASKLPGEPPKTGW